MAPRATSLVAGVFPGILVASPPPFVTYHKFLVRFRSCCCAFHLFFFHSLCPRQLSDYDAGCFAFGVFPSIVFFLLDTSPSKETLNEVGSLFFLFGSRDLPSWSYKAPALFSDSVDIPSFFFLCV